MYGIPLTIDMRTDTELDYIAVSSAPPFVCKFSLRAIFPVLPSPSVQAKYLLAVCLLVSAFFFFDPNAVRKTLNVDPLPHPFKMARKIWFLNAT